MLSFEVVKLNKHEVVRPQEKGANYSFAFIKSYCLTPIESLSLLDFKEWKIEEKFEIISKHIEIPFPYEIISSLSLFLVYSF